MGVERSKKAPANVAGTRIPKQLGRVAAELSTTSKCQTERSPTVTLNSAARSAGHSRLAASARTGTRDSAPLKIARAFGQFPLAT